MRFCIIFCFALFTADESGQWSLPRIDLTPLLQEDPWSDNVRETIAKLQQAAAEVGFFSVVNHGVSPYLNHKIHAAAIGFFDYAEGTKRSFALQEYNPQSQSRYRGFWPREVFGKEGLSFSNPSWRTRKSNMACHEPINFKLYERYFGTEWIATVDRYYGSMLGLGQILVNAITNSNSISIDSANSISSLRFNHYPHRDPDEQPRHFGRDGEPLSLEEHVDSALITILTQDNVGGLELLGMDNVWHPIPPSEPGTLIVNTGRALSVITDGRYNATNHRVKWTRSRRISIPFFVEPSPDFPMVSLSLSDEEKAAADGYWRWMLTELTMKGEFAKRGKIFLAEMDSHMEHTEL